VQGCRSPRNRAAPHIKIGRKTERPANGPWTSLDTQASPKRCMLNRQTSDNREKGENGSRQARAKDVVPKHRRSCPWPERGTHRESKRKN